MDMEHQDQEYERDEQLLEARRLKRLEQKRKRKMQQRIVLGGRQKILLFKTLDALLDLIRHVLASSSRLCPSWYAILKGS